MPGTKAKVVTRLDKDNVERFLRVYIRFQPQKEGFAGCRPFIGLDGCHLKGYFGGQLLVAVGKDADEGIFPLCFAIVEQENKESWKWFLDEIFRDFGGPDDRSWVFISDKQKGLVEVFNEFKNVEHRWCMRHMNENFARQFKEDALKELLQKLAHCTTERKFDRELENVRSINEDVYRWISERPPQGWVKAYFSSTARSALQVNNLAESFNSWILKTRDKPIIQLIDAIRIQLMEMFNKRRKLSCGFRGQICPEIQTRLEAIKNDTYQCFPRECGKNRFEVDIGQERYTVDLSSKSCSCKDWDLSGIPCKHAAATIMFNDQDPEDYVNNYYATSTYKLIYSPSFEPVGGPREWIISTQTPVQPPLVLQTNLI